MPEEDREILADNLRRFLADRGWSQGALARRLGVSERAIARYVAAEQWPDALTTRKITAVTGWTSEDLSTPKAKVVPSDDVAGQAPGPDWEVRTIGGVPVAFKKGIKLGKAQLEALEAAMLTPEKRSRLAKATAETRGKKI